jgi:hypothetical protein
VRFAIVPESLIRQGDPLRIMVYSRIYLSLVMRQTINCRDIQSETGLSYGIVYRLKRLAETTLGNATNKPNAKGMKTKRKPHANLNLNDPGVNEVDTMEHENNMKRPENPVKSERKPNANSPRHTGILRLVLEQEQEIEQELLTIEQILALGPRERQIYIETNQRRLKQKGVI